MRIYYDKSSEESYEVGCNEARIHIIGRHIGIELLQKLRALKEKGYANKDVHEAMKIFSDDTASKDFLNQIIASPYQDSFIKGYVDTICSSAKANGVWKIEFNSDLIMSYKES